MSSVSITKAFSWLKAAAPGLGLAVLLMADPLFVAGDEAASQGSDSSRQKVAGASKSTGSADVKFFITIAPSQFQKDPTPQQIEKAQQAKESRPAAQDPEGHWGGTTEGFQLSVRFEKDGFHPGEPIVAAVIIRNATDKKVFYRDFISMREDSPLCQFDVLDEKQQPVPRLDPKAPDDVQDGPHIPRLLSPGTQCRYEVNLAARFKLVQPGKYSIRARRWVHKLDHDGYSQLKSSQAAITILNVTNNPNGATAATHAEVPSIR